MKKILDIIQRDSRFENEPKRIPVLLRWVYILMAGYYSIFEVLMMVGSPQRFSWLAMCAFLAMIPAFLSTYYIRTKYNLMVYAAIQLAWIVAFVYLYGWDCGVQHFMFSLLVLIYFSVYDALTMKVICTVLLFILRYSMFRYCRAFDPLVVLPDKFIVALQVYNSMFLFLSLGAICGAFSSNIELAEKKLVLHNERLQMQASTDPLTGIWNRRTMLWHMEQYQVQNPKNCFAIAMGDIDHFKQINDKWGHDCGDAVLIWISELLSYELRGKGRICRWGGEEFLFHLPNMNGDEAYSIIAEMAMRLKRSDFQWKDESIHITMTFGMEENDFHSNLEELISRVDEKLYYGKAGGRNRIVF